MVAAETGITPQALAEDVDMTITIWQVLQDKAEAIRKARR